MAHDFELERTALYALGVLPAQEIEEVEVHLVSCPLCMDEYAELRDTASLIGLSAEIAGDEHALRLKRIKRKLGIAMHRRPRLPQPVTPARDSWYRAVAALAACIAVGVSFWTVSLSRELAVTRAALQQVGMFAAQDIRHYDVSTGVVISHAGHVSLAMSKLPVLPAQRVFQVWTLTPGAHRVAPSITFVRDAQGRAFISVPARPLGITAVAISIEPVGGSMQPTTKPLFIQPLT